MQSTLTPQDLRDVIEALPVGLRVVDDAGSTVYLNQAGLAHAREGDRDEASAGQVVRFEHSKIEVNGRSYTICLSHDVTEQSHREDELFRHAYFDVLTGLPNRAYLDQKIVQMMQEPGAMFALAFIDLDDFKQVNDRHGHAVGDTLLVEIARRLSQETRQTDMLARIGGDEFVLCVSAVAFKQDVSTIIGRYLDQIKQPFSIAGQEIFTSASIGVSFYPDDGVSFAALYAAADHAMYGSKAAAKGRFRFYRSDDRHGRANAMIPDLHPQNGQAGPDLAEVARILKANEF